MWLLKLTNDSRETLEYIPIIKGFSKEPADQRKKYY